MNSYSAGTTPYGYGASSLSPPASSPNSKTMAHAYRRDAPDGLDDDAPPFNPAVSNQVPRKGRVDLKDPIQVHLLTETALSDSKGYEILTQEEVDEMKKQSHLLSQRVESTRTNLAIQSKYRDAAVSMAKLYGPGGANGSQPGDSGVMDAEREREACERKCQELAAELFNLEKRLMGPQRRLLEHTAGILQLTHRASRKNARLQQGQLMNGIPGSPESLYTFSQSRNSFEQAADGDYQDDPSVYQLESLDAIQTRGLPRKNPIEIPMKSPIREQNQLRGEMDRVREENMQLRGQTDMLIKKLQGLNVSLRETIVRFNPEVNSEYLEPPSVSAKQDAKPAAFLKSQVEYLESGLVAVQAEQESFAGGRELGELGERLESLNLQVRDLLMSSDPHYTPTPIPQESDVQGQLAYLEDSLRLADSQLGRALSRGGKDGETGPVLTSLWDSIQNGFVEARKRKDERRRARVDKGVPDEDDMSEDEEFDATEPYSLASFSSRVQWLHSQASTLKDQKYVLKRQIKQQRELNNKSDAEKDEEISRRQEELEQTRQLLARAEKDAMDAQSMLSDAIEDLEHARSSSGAVEAAQAELHQRNAEIDALEIRLTDIQIDLAAAEAAQAELQQSKAKIENLETKLRDVQTSLTAADAAQTELQRRDADIDALETKLRDAQSNLAAADAAQAEVQQNQAQIEALETKLRDAQSNLAAANAAQTELQQSKKRIVALETKLSDVETKMRTAEVDNRGAGQKLADVDSRIASLTEEKAAAEETAQSLRKELEETTATLKGKNKAMKVKEDELELLNMSLAELKTEVTIARAELDVAYGSRAERAADVAALKNSAEVQKLHNQVEKLKKELGETVQELEEITKETIGAEREKVELEVKLDEALSAKAALDVEVQKSREKMSKLQEELDGERLRIGPGHGNGARAGAGAAVLSEQFRATMREERKKFQEDLREERTRCRRLEEELSRLKRSQGPGKSPLSPR